jgi:glyoxylase-like metal-dependent hydrolase (beta-lactamase superfamily II)
MSVAVDLGEQLVILAGDTSYTEQLMLDEAADGVTTDPATATATLSAIRALTEQRACVYLPTHDPESESRLAGMRAEAL